MESLPTKKARKQKTKRVKTDEEKLAATKRLAAAREKRLRENPPQYKNVHPDVLKLDDNHEWSYNNVKHYIKHQKGVLSDQMRDFKRGLIESQAPILSTQLYINNMETYLKTNVWLDRYWGENRDNEVVYVCQTLAYYNEGRQEGLPKRTSGVFYRDIGLVYNEYGNDDSDK